MKILKTILLSPYYIVKFFVKGILTLALFLSRGFYFYLICFVKIIKKILPFKFFNNLIKHFEKRQNQPEYALVLILWGVSIFALYNLLYVDVGEVQHHELSGIGKTTDSINKKVEPKVIENSDNSGYKDFVSRDLSTISIKESKDENSDVVVWLSVDGTNINYPIVKANDNDFYLNHSYNKEYKNTGWTFMDYRNNPNMTDKNTIFYGHNLLNKTAFGSISNLFGKTWSKTSKQTIIVLTTTMRYTYKIFSAYYIDPEVYYLQTDFKDDEYKEFISTLSKRNIIDVDNSVNENDRIITLSTCTEDNKGRKVVHAKLIGEEEIF